MLADRCQDLGLVTATCLPTAHVSCLLMLPPSTSLPGTDSFILSSHLQKRTLLDSSVRQGGSDQSRHPSQATRCVGARR